MWVDTSSPACCAHVRSIERMLEYTRLPSEPPRCSDGAPRPPPGWPSAAWLEFERVSACYRPGLPPVLQDLSFAVPVRGGLCLPPDHVLLKPVILCLINYGCFDARLAALCRESILPPHGSVLLKPNVLGLIALGFVPC